MNPGLLDLLAQSAEAQRADPTQRPACPDERPHDCAAIDAEPRPLPLAQQPTVRPPRCGCGRPEIAGHACAGCAAPQWVDWPTHAGWWWFSADGSRPILIEADESLDFFDTRRQRLEWRFGDERDWYMSQGLAFRFLDARLTPPAAPVAR